MREKFRDKTRDDLTHALNSLGIQAEMAERGRAEEKVHNAWHQRSLGIIDLPVGPVRWINVIKKDGSQYSPPSWWVNLCIPDETPVSSHDTVKIRTVRKKTFPLLGKVVGATWMGDDASTGLVQTLSIDDIVAGLAARIGNLEIRSYAQEFQGWTLQVDRRFTPTNEDWASIEKIADYLLSAPRTF